MRYIRVALWAPCALLAVILAALPLGVEAQLALSLSALLAMGLIKLLRLRGTFRFIFLALGTFVILRYLAWRLSSTIPTIQSPLDFTAGIILVAAEIYCVVMLFLSLFTVSDPVDRARAPAVSEEDAPSVDIFVPTYNEAPEILAATLAAAKRIAYPAGKVSIFLLDDGGTDEKLRSDDHDVATRASNRRKTLQALCAEFGVRYLTREANTHAKAGNLNNGLVNSTGDLIVVFDADHAPAPEFLRETVGYFEQDPKLFLVQTPHFFLNPDPIERNIEFRHIPAENEMFYGLVQKGLDKWNAAFFCGSAAVLRRTALEQVGGFHGSSITEDAESALELHARGWNSLYVDRPMIAGLQPETFDSFIGQRSRWCRGMVQILLLKNPLFVPGLQLAQRLSYLSSSLFWLFPLSRMIFIFAPMLYIFFDMKIYAANEQEFLAYTLTYMVSALMIQSYVFRRVRWPWVSDVYEYIQAVFLFKAVISVFIDPRRPKFNVTAKGQTLEENRLSELAGPYFFIFGLVAASLAFLGYRYTGEPNAHGLMIVVGLWSLLNLFLTGIGLGAVAERRERRTAPRAAAQVAARLILDGQPIDVTVQEMSINGARVTVPSDLKVAARMTGTLVFAENAGEAAVETPVAIVGRRSLDGRSSLGLRFFGQGAERFRLIARGLYGDIGEIHARRRRTQITPGIAVATAMFAGTWVQQVARGLAFGMSRRPSVSVPLSSREQNV